MVAFEENSADALAFYVNSIHDGVNLFQNFFQDGPKIFTPPNGQFPIGLEPILRQNGIEAIVRPRFARLSPGKGNRLVLFDGSLNRRGLINHIRNCQFEPTLFNTIDKSVAKCLNQIDSAFKFRKPAVISSHRVNFSTGVSQLNGEFGLRSLRKLLQAIVKKWPDVRFISSRELIKMQRVDCIKKV
jgi:hypothetical protein